MPPGARLSGRQVPRETIESPGCTSPRATSNVIGATGIWRLHRRCVSSAGRAHTSQMARSGKTTPLKVVPPRSRLIVSYVEHLLAKEGPIGTPESHWVGRSGTADGDGVQATDTEGTPRAVWSLRERGNSRLHCRAPRGLFRSGRLNAEYTNRFRPRVRVLLASLSGVPRETFQGPHRLDFRSDFVDMKQAMRDA